MSFLLGESRQMLLDVLIYDTTDPDAITQAPVDFIASGYSDGDYANNLTKGKHTFTMTDERSGLPATVMIGGVPTVAYQLPLMVKSAHPAVNILEFNGPTVVGTYLCTSTYEKTAGASRAIATWEEIWR